MNVKGRDTTPAQRSGRGDCTESGGRRLRLSASARTHPLTLFLLPSKLPVYRHITITPLLLPLFPLATMASFPSTAQQALPPPVVASDGQQRIVQRVLAAKTPWRKAGDDESSRVRMIKNEAVAGFGEFIGTTWFLFFAL